MSNKAFYRTLQRCLEDIVFIVDTCFVRESGQIGDEYGSSLSREFLADVYAYMYMPYIVCSSRGPLVSDLSSLIRSFTLTNQEYISCHNVMVLVANQLPN